MQRILQPEDIEDMTRQMYPKIYQYFYVRMHQVPLAQEMTQEVFVRFFGHYEQYTHQGKLLQYLYTIAHRLWVDWCRQSQPCQEEYLDEETGSEIYAGPALFFRKETIRMVQRHVERLPLPLQEIVRLRYEEQLRFTQMASILDLPVTTVKSRHAKALSLLKEEMKKEGDV